MCDWPIYIRDALIFNVECMHAAGSTGAVKYITFWMQARPFFWMHFWIRIPGVRCTVTVTLFIYICSCHALLDLSAMHAMIAVKCKAE